MYSTVYTAELLLYHIDNRLIIETIVVVVDLFNLPVGLFRFKLQYYVLKFTI
jgi:hypothetical protein